jgi:Amt family ammonium transporter
MRIPHSKPLLAALGTLPFLCTGAFAVDPVQIKAITDINTGDTAWMLVSSALVLMMTGPALALFYGGLVRRKNVLGTMMQSFALMAIVSVLWAVVGYSLAFDVGNPFIGGFRFAFLNGVGAEPSEYAATIPHTLWMIYQMMFAIITPALICGAYAERMKFSSMVLFSCLWLLAIYCPMAHMVWGKGGLLNAWFPPDGTGIKALDFAGGTVVHISSGISALICAFVLGKRTGFGKLPMPPHSVVLSFIGAALLWVGWFGFNAGSALAANGLAANAFVTTHLAAATATLGWVFAEWLKTGKPTVLGAISGAVAGLVVITPAAGFVTPNYALLMGFIGGVVCMLAATVVKSKLGYDDSLDAFGVHGVGGTLGAILTGVFATAAANAGLKSDTLNLEGLLAGNGGQLVNQLGATGLTLVFASIGAFVLLQITKAIVGLRVTEEHENVGLDLSQHGEAGYVLEEEVTGVVDSHGHPVEPRASNTPPDGKRRFAVVIEGVETGKLLETWSGMCHAKAAPSDDFKQVYPYFSTVSGNKFRFTGGDPGKVSESIAKLFKGALGNQSIRAKVEA